MHSLYLREGFLHLQNAVSLSIIERLANKTVDVLVSVEVRITVVVGTWRYLAHMKGYVPQTWLKYQLYKGEVGGDFLPHTKAFLCFSTYCEKMGSCG